MAGIRWQIRRTETYDIEDGLYLSEMIVHTDDKRFGIMDDVYLSWWPYIAEDGSQMTLPSNWLLAGRSGNYFPHTQMSFKTPSEIVFSPVDPKYPYIESTAPVVPPILHLTDAQQTYNIAADERLNNGAPNSLENFDIDKIDLGYSIPLNVNSKTANILQLSGNGFIWVKNPDFNLNISVQDVGTIDNSLAIKNKNTQNNTWAAKGRNVIGFHTPASAGSFSNIGRGVGYRSFVYDPELIARKLTFSFVIDDYLIPGLMFSTRIGYNNNWQLFSTALTGTGQKHVTYFYDPSSVRAANVGNPLAIDWFYDWFYDPSVFPLGQEIKMEIACLGVYDGWVPAAQLNPAYHAFTEENSLASMYGVSARKVYAYQPTGTVTFHTPMLNDGYRLSLKTTKDIKVLEKNRNGFVYYSDNANANEAWTFTYSTKCAGDVSDVM